MESVLIKSRDRLSVSSSSSNFKIRLQEPLNGRYRVECISMPNLFYNVNSSNYSVYTSLGDVNLTPGYYTSSSFVTHLQTQLQTVDANYTVTLDSNTKKITVANTGAFTLDFGTDTTASARILMGFNQADTASGTSVTGDNPINLAPQPIVFIDIPQNNQQIMTSSVSSSLRGCLMVPLSSAFGSFEILRYSDLPQIVDLYQPTNTLDIGLYDDQGNAMSLNNHDWTMLLTKL